MQNLSEVETGLIVAVDTSYLLLTGMNILIMQVGFAALEAGGARAKHVKSLLFKNFMDHAVGALAWFTVGWGLFIGADPFAAGPGSTFFVHPLHQYARLFQQFAFAATASTIVSGAVIGRCRLEAYVVLSFFMTGITYPIAAHWAWADFGWLRTLGFLDFAGSCVVHAFGGSVALACAWMCGPRPGRFVTDKQRLLASMNTIESSYHGPNRGGLPAESSVHTVNRGAMQPDLSFHGSSRMISNQIGQLDGSETVEATSPSPNKFHSFLRSMVSRLENIRICRRPVVYQTRVMPRGYNPPLMVVGSLLLYVAWFSFNAGSSGSTFSGPDAAVRAAVNTLLAAGASSTACMVLTLMARVKYDIEIAVNSMLAGLVAITAPCGYIDPWAAVVVGFLACPVYIVSAWFVLKILGVDDSLGAASVHGSAGILGTLWLGFTHPDFGLFYGHGAKFLGVQALGSLVICSFAAVTAILVIFLPFKLLKKLSYAESEQLIGIDFIHFGGEFGKDVDLEGDSHRRNSFHSDKDEVESDGNKSANSSFIEEFPPTTLGENTAAGSFSYQRAPPTHTMSSSILGTNTESSQHGHKTTRSMSTNTFEGRRVVHSELRRVLDEDPRMRHRFRAYLEVMHKDEGVAFWDAVVKWKEISSKKNADRKVKEAKKILKTYCLESAVKQVNLASKSLKQLTIAMEDREELLKNSLFDAALEELFKDLRHDFSEFVNNTPAYWV